MKNVFNLAATLLVAGAIALNASSCSPSKSENTNSSQSTAKEVAPVVAEPAVVEPTATEWQPVVKTDGTIEIFQTGQAYEPFVTNTVFLQTKLFETNERYKRLVQKHGNDPQIDFFLSEAKESIRIAQQGRASSNNSWGFSDIQRIATNDLNLAIVRLNLLEHEYGTKQ